MTTIQTVTAIEVPMNRNHGFFTSPRRNKNQYTKSRRDVAAPDSLQLTEAKQHKTAAPPRSQAERVFFG